MSEATLTPSRANCPSAGGMVAENALLDDIVRVIIRAHGRRSYYLGYRFCDQAE
jgi:hypothetical protein